MASIAIGSIIKSGNRIKIRANLGGQLANILIDSGAACSCTDIPLPLTNETIPIQGIGDTIMIATKTQPVQLDLGVTVLKESLWYLPNNSEGTVLGMDIMRKYGFVIHCFEKQIELKTEKTVKQCLPKKITSVMSISTPDPIQQMVNKHDSIWATHEHDCGLIDFVVCIEGEPPPPQKQYRIKPEAESAVHEIVHQLETRGIVRRCSSTTNSPCLTVPKSNGKWRLCIDLLIKLSENTSAQEAELIALLEAIRSHHEPLCVYTDSRYAFGTVHDFMAQWQLRKFLTSAGTPIKHFNTITSIWQEIRARDSSLSVVKVRAHIIKNPDENKKNNNIADQLAKLAAQKGDEWKPDRLVVPAVSAIQTIPIDLKQYQQELWSSDGELTPHLQQDQLVKVTEGMILRDDKYIVPEALQKPVIKLYHDYAHVSAPKTQQLIQKNFWWPQMASDIQRWCDTCIVCATINQGKPGRTKLCRPEPPKGPWELLQLDFIGPLPSAKGRYRYCLVIIDKFSKWVEAIPTRNNSANTVARVVANQILPLWGAPIQIESDQGTHFTGQVMKQICQMLNIKQRFHIPYRPQSSGMVERANRTIKESISKQVAQHKNQWIDALPTVLTILRATPSKATGISPFELMTGRVMKLPIDPEIAPADLGPLVVATQQSVLKQLRERLEVLHARAALKQQQSDLTNDTQFNPTSEVKFSEGDMVMVRVFVKQGAFTPRWHGPYEVKAICNSCVATTVKGKLRWYHMSQCKSFKSTKIQ